MSIPNNGFIFCGLCGEMIFDVRDGIQLYGGVKFDVSVQVVDGAMIIRSKVFDATIHKCRRRSAEIEADISEIING